MTLETPPERDEIEVTVFGPGYGESVLFHLGDNHWFVVDSCIDETLEPSALTYLRKIGIDPEPSIQQVIATHWHDDHIRGISKIFSASTSAQFVCSGALRPEEFLTLVQAYGKRSMMTSTGVQEFYEVIETLKTRAPSYPPTFAVANRHLWQRTNSLGDCSVVALSPSDQSLVTSKRRIAALVNELSSQKERVPSLRPNDTAVVLRVTAGPISVLLGSDLEEATNRGWSIIVNSTVRSSGKSSLFKVPHHGSITSECAAVWAEMVEPEPNAVLTPFFRGNVSLPSREDVDRICTLTKQSFTTAGKRGPRSPRRPRVVEDEIRSVARFLRPVRYSTGQVRFRASPLNDDAGWRIELFGDAIPLRNMYA